MINDYVVQRYCCSALSTLLPLQKTGSVDRLVGLSQLFQKITNYSIPDFYIVLPVIPAYLTHYSLIIPVGCWQVRTVHAASRIVMGCKRDQYLLKQPHSLHPLCSSDAPTFTLRRRVTVNTPLPRKMRQGWGPQSIKERFRGT